MKKHILLLTAILLAFVAGISPAADSLDLMVSKIAGDTPKPGFNTLQSFTSFALQDKSNNVVVNALNGQLEFQGSTFDAFSTKFAISNPTANRTITFPDKTGTVTLAQASTTTALTSDNQVVTPGINTRLQLTSNNATDTNRTFTLSATGAITGQIYVIVGPASNACEIADTGIQKLSATWSPGATDTLTLLFDGTNFLELARSNN